ncbi:hypothetical protein ONS95_011841 [Cadophora gregata]|uniref:uncharacterized protein n=1 Tax=Cadophora gregata TaxID=51156 RepID=UPI0026DAD743|nr:uncharacterized protein ONS95_011841 [Cadophora gregata]KAK0117501.1 hypothetical protein ONS95_011841 [Cadophora gregata]
MSNAAYFDPFPFFGSDHIRILVWCNVDYNLGGTPHSRGCTPYLYGVPYFSGKRLCMTATPQFSRRLRATNLVHVTNKSVSPTMEVQSVSRAGDVQRPALLRVALELRREIYRYLIPTKRIIDVHNPRFPYMFSNRESPGLDSQGLDMVDDISDLGSSPAEHSETVHSDIGTPDDDPFPLKTEGDDFESGLPKMNQKKDVTGLDDSANAAYEMESDEITPSWGIDKKRNCILLVCKQISDEALDVMYGENVFRHCLHIEGDVPLKLNFTDRNRRRMRMLLLTAEHGS